MLNSWPHSNTISFCASHKVRSFQFLPFHVSLLSCFYSVAIHEGQGLLCHTEVRAYGLGRTAAGGKSCALATHSMSAPLLGAEGDARSSYNRLCGTEDRHQPSRGAD